MSVCPECLAVVPAVRVAEGDRIILKKRCPEHGAFEAVVWRGEPSYLSWGRPRAPSFPLAPQTALNRGCPWDCGLCPEHRQQTCCVLIEVTRRCDLSCNVCFADAGGGAREDPDIETIRGMYRTLLAAGGPYNIQLSGGEPTVRDDLPEIVSLALSMGFDFVQLNTNGLRLAKDPAYVRKLRKAGLSCVFLQFDGLEEAVYRTLRGRPLCREKDLAVERCVENGLGVILVPTLVPGVNIDQIGPVIDYAVSRLPGVRGVHFQPVSYFGRYPNQPRDEDRITIPEVVTEIEKQTNGLIRATGIAPSGAANCYCAFHGNFVLMPDGELKPWTAREPASCCSRPEDAGQKALQARRFVSKFWSAPADGPRRPGEGPGLGGWDVFLERVRTHTLCLSGMAFQDAWNLDLERLRDCHLHVLHPDGRIVPFCAYNLTDSAGRSFYRGFAPVPSGQRMSKKGTAP